MTTDEQVATHADGTKEIFPLSPGHEIVGAGYVVAYTDDGDRELFPCGTRHIRAQQEQEAAGRRRRVQRPQRFSGEVFDESERRAQWTREFTESNQLMVVGLASNSLCVSSRWLRRQTI